MATITPTLTTFPGRAPGNGLCLFFFDSRKEFFPGGPGSALGYAPYTGDMALNTSVSATVNPVQGAFLGVGFDVKGDFGTTHDSKPGYNILGSDNSAITGCAYNTKAHNTITTRAGELSSYKILSTTPNLSTYPLSGAPDESYSESGTVDPYTLTPAHTLHQSVTSRDDIQFTSIKVTLQDNGRRLRVEMKPPGHDMYYPYQIVDLGSGVGARSVPNDGITQLRAGLAFTTSDSVMNCDIKNISVYGAYSPVEKQVAGIHPGSTAKYRIILSADGGC
tara:strand:+ start:1115 stop:1945 length:831 start_codon:yes stop_codon:yes gene_type:complete